RTEEMSLETIDKILKIVRENDKITTIELTGGEPLLNPHFRYFVRSLTETGRKIMVASNLTLCTEHEMEDIPAFLAENRVKVYASLPSLYEEDVDRQRGKGTYVKVIAVLKRLNDLGYGKEGSGLELDIEYNPSGPAIAPDRKILENLYREKLDSMHGIKFNKLITLTNAPLGRLRKSMSEDKYEAYMKELEDAFNPSAVETMMCRHMLTVCHDEKFYDCGFLHKLDMPVKYLNATIDGFDYETLSRREIATNPLCLICTAGGGLNCFPDGL
ncbi:MAG: DUF3641 domain-containing protein, partial [Nitrospirota bacterium]